MEIFSEFPAFAASTMSGNLSFLHEVRSLLTREGQCGRDVHQTTGFGGHEY